MKFVSIEFKNIFAYGESVNKIEYSDTGKMTLLKGISGAGKSAILSLPTLVLYGRLMSVTKSGIANRINKHGWIRGTIVKGQDTFVIEREFAPNSLTIWKNDVQLDHFGSSDAEDYIQTEIRDFPIPLNTFSNMICISMKNFKSFLSMSPTDRKKLMDELFDVSIIMAVAESLKSDAKELGNSINGDNGTLFSLNQTLGNSQKELAQIQAKNSTPESLDKIEQNNKQIETLNSQMAQYNEAMKTVAEKQQENRNAIDAKNREITENSMVLRQIQEKINLFSQSKCPTCGTPFTGDIFEEARKKLDELKAERTEQATRLNNERAELMAKTSKIEEARKKVDNGIYQIRINVNNLLNENALINEKVKATAEYTAVENIINQTQAQIDDIKAGINEKTAKLTRLQQLQKVYSLDGVLRLMIENWVPALNEEIGEYLTLLNFPYMLKFDSKLNATVTDMGQNVPIETLSEGEKTRLNVVIVLSLVKIIKKRMPSLNVMSFAETISTLDTMTSELLLSMLYAYAEEQALNIIVVSHTDLSLELFDEIIEVEKQNGFSKFEIKNNVL